MNIEAHLAENISGCHLGARLAASVRQHELSKEVRVGTDPKKPFLQFENTSIYDVADPLSAVAAEVAAMASPDNLDAVVMFGFGLGLHAKAIQQKFSLPIIVFEPNLDLLKAGLSHQKHDIPDLTVVHRPSELLAVMDTVLYQSNRQILAGAIPAYVSLFPNELAQFKKTVGQALDTIALQQHNLAERGAVWSRYTIENIPSFSLLKSVEALKGACKGMPGIVVGSGPSLTQNIDALKGAKGKAMICAANSAVKPLAEAGIVPEMVAIIESNDQTINFEGVPHLDRMVLAMPPETHPAHYHIPFKHHLNVIHLGSIGGDWLHRGYDTTQLPSGGSVACTCMAILHLLGCDPIVLVGMDLAYTDLKGHTTGSDQAESLQYIHRPETRQLEVYRQGVSEPVRVVTVDSVPAWGGTGDVLTYNGFTIYRNWFENAAGTWASDRTFINATEGGARYDGVAEERLASLIETWSNAPSIEMLIDETLEKAPMPDEKTLPKVIEEERARLKEIGQLAKRSVLTARRARGLLQKKKINQAKSMMATLEKQEGILRRQSRSSRLLNQYMGAKAGEVRDRRLEDVSDDPVLQAAQSLSRSAMLFSMLNGGVTELLSLFETTLPGRKNVWVKNAKLNS